MRKAAIVLVSLVVILVLAVAILPRIIGGNTLKPQIADAVREATGRELTIGGDIDLALLPNVSVSASDIALSNAPGGDPAEMLTVESIDLSLALLPLIGRDVVVQKLVVQSPKVVLRQDEAGRGNWEFEGKAPAEPAEPAGEGEAGGSPLAALRLGDVRILDGALSFASDLTGASYEVSDFELAAMLPDLDSPLSLDGGFNMNGQAVALDLSVETPGQAMEQEPFAVAASLQSELITAGYEGQVQQQPVPGLDGQFDLNIGSVGALLAWLQQPLPEGQPDPGSLAASARFTGDGAKATLEEAKIEGEGLQATASGSIDGSGDVTKIALVVESGVLDIDRYLPPEQPSAADSGAAEMAGEATSPKDMVEGLSDEPIDLGALKSTDADVRVKLGGIKAKGYEIGPVGLTVLLQGGKLTADLAEVQLYGGSVAAQVALDGSGEALGADVGLTVDKVDLGALAAVAQPEGELPVSGVVSAAVEMATQGASPRALAQAAVGKVEVDLGGVDVKDERAAALSELKLRLDLPGLESEPSLDAQAVYNGQKVAVAVKTAPIGKVMGGESFALDAKVESKLVTAGYAGQVHQQPQPGLDGSFDLNIGSVGKLLSWLGEPLPKEQPDPGPFAVTAQFTGDGAKATLEEAKLSGKGLEATARGSLDASGEVKKIALVIDGGVLDVDSYLPPPKPAAESASAAAAPAASSPQELIAGLSDEPIDLAFLQGNEADVKINLGGVKAMGYELGEIALSLLLQNGKLDIDLAELGLYGGKLTAAVDLDGSGGALGVTLGAALDGVDIVKLAAAAQAGAPPPVTGLASAALQIAATGASPRALAESLKANLENATIDGPAMKASANASVEGGSKNLRFDANVNIDSMDLNALLPPAEDGGAAPAEPAGQGQGGWSTEPLLLEPLHLANGQVTLTSGRILYKELAIERMSGKLTLEGGVLDLGLDELALADGGVSLAAKLDASGEAAALDYNASVKAVQAKDLLKAASGIDWLSGLANFEAKGSARGKSQRDLVGSLNGSGSFQFLDGAIEGINLAETLRNVGTLGMGGSDSGGGVPKTDFTELSGSFTITDGIVNNPDMKMLAPLIRLSGNGDVPLPPQSIDYGVEAKLVASLEGQGGDEALAGLPIPIRITGPWSGMSYEVDWQSVFQQAATDPARLANMPAEMGDMAKQFGVDLPLPGLGGEGGAAGAVLEQLPGASGEGGAAGAVGSVLKSVTGGGEGEGAEQEGGGAAGALGAGLKGLLGDDQKSEEGAAPAAEPAAEAQPEAAPAEETAKDPAGEAVEEGVKAIKGLFGN